MIIGKFIDYLATTALLLVAVFFFTWPNEVGASTYLSNEFNQIIDTWQICDNATGAEPHTIAIKFIATTTSPRYFQIHARNSGIPTTATGYIAASLCSGTFSKDTCTVQIGTTLTMDKAWFDSNVPTSSDWFTIADFSAQNITNLQIGTAYYLLLSDQFNKLSYRLIISGRNYYTPPGGDGAVLRGCGSDQGHSNAIRVYSLTPQVCGNSILEGTETCDYGADNGSFVEGCNESCNGFIARTANNTFTDITGKFINFIVETLVYLFRYVLPTILALWCLVWFAGRVQKFLTGRRDRQIFRETENRIRRESAESYWAKITKNKK